MPSLAQIAAALASDVRSNANIAQSWELMLHVITAVAAAKAKKIF